MALDKTAAVGYDGVMRQFKYEAMDATGAVVSGTLNANNEDEIQHAIRQEGYFITSIREVVEQRQTFGNNIPQVREKYLSRRSSRALIIGIIVGFITGFALGLIF